MELLVVVYTNFPVKVYVSLKIVMSDDSWKKKTG